MFVNLLAPARDRIDILVYAAVFLHEAYPRLNDLLTERAEAGCALRIAVGDADSANVQQRGMEERFGHRHRITLSSGLDALPGVGINAGHRPADPRHDAL
ncbi:hypothetical protein ACFTS5_12930 [Nocardia sp. NPDC056952]|uniref:hypothetical protein n=1 Tax=Nocardia sp. NPDC056952 TaxID=3345979 RepID=UPI003627A19E